MKSDMLFMSAPYMMLNLVQFNLSQLLYVVQ